MVESLSLLQLLLAVVIISVAFFIRGIAGFGSGLIAIPLLALMLPLPLVVPMVGLLDYVASNIHGVRHRHAIAWRDILPLFPFSLIGVACALYLFKTVDAYLLRKALGSFVLLYGLYSLVQVGASRPGSRWWAIIAGGFGGFIGTLFGTGGPFYVIYLRLRGLDMTVFRATVATIFIIDGGVRIGGYLLSGFYTKQTLLAFAMALPIMAITLYLGGRVHTSISQRTFQRGIGLLLMVSGISLLLR
jgi:uncharacterized membrane protein YfcA